jgi:Holliday junction resolvasome RuvABC ATP-dependent DNA helicase subunit
MSAVRAKVNRFVDELSTVLVGLGSAAGESPVPPDRLRHDCAIEAFGIACGVLAGDGRQSDDELWELAAGFGTHLDGEIGGATPADIRTSGVVERFADRLSAPSEMFRLLVDVDRSRGTSHARTYYDVALGVAFAMAAADFQTSEAEVQSIESWRGQLLAGLDAAGEAPKPAGAPGADMPPTEPPTPPDPPEPLEDLLAELDALVGMASVKREVRLVADLTRIEQIRRERDLPVLEQSRHLVFTGNPGTGKTTVARLLSRIYRTLGIVEKGHLVETDRSGLVAGYVGQTATKVVAAFDEADQGTLLIDEAYSLIRGGDDDFGREAIDTIVKLVEDRRDRLVVILTGYTGEMGELVAANPGMKSRFPKTVHFPDYTSDELVAILEMTAGRGHYRITDDAKDRARAWLDAIPRDEGFGNGRLVRNLFEHAVGRQATRLAAAAGTELTDDQLLTLEAVDFLEPGEPL